MNVLGLSHYNLRAPLATLDVLRDFYIDVVGLQLGDRPPFASNGYWLYAGRDAVLHLSEAGPGEHRTLNVNGTFDHVAFSCTGLRQFEAHLEARGIAYHSDAVPLTSQHQLFFVDPAGNGVELNFAGAD